MFMPKSKADWEKTMNELSKSFPEQFKNVQSAMGFITKEDLSGTDAVQTFALKCQERRDLLFSQKKVADKLDISRQSVSLKEKPDLEETTEVDPYYLKAFSIIYGCSPLYLLGKVDSPDAYVIENDKALINPFQCFSPDLAIKADYIIYKLLSNHKCEQLLPDFVEISKANFEHQKNIKNMLLSAPAIEKLQYPELDKTDIKKRCSDITFNFNEGDICEQCANLSINLDKDNVSESNADKIIKLKFKRLEYINAATFSLIQLGQMDESLLDMMVKISSDESLSQIVHQWLRLGGFLK